MVLPKQSGSIDLVILLHGNGHPLGNMRKLESALLADGYKTLNISYPLFKYNLEQLADWLARKIDSEEIWQNHSCVHFVTLSMGGVLAALYLDRHKQHIPKEKMGRVVMLGPPNGGSELADKFHGWRLYKRLLGPSGQELTTADRHANKVKPWYDLGIIAGVRKCYNILGIVGLPRKNDGCVTVDSTKLDGMKDHMTVRATHLFLGWNRTARQQMLEFLKNGQFNSGQR